MTHPLPNFGITYSNLNENHQCFKQARLVTEQMIESIKEKQDFYKIFDIENAKQQAKSCSHHATYIRDNFADLIIVGMGGAILNPATTISLVAEKNLSTKIHFLHSTDPLYLQKTLSSISLKSCAVLVISNSGETLETNALLGTLIAEFQKNKINDLGKHFYFITNPVEGTLYKVAKRIGATILPHADKISGRYSGLTNVTTFASQIAGIDVEQYLEGAKNTIDDFLNNQEQSQSVLAAAAIFNTSKPMMINIGYLQQFDIFLEWYSQIIAESLGKAGKGITPVRGLGPNDQHSMLQLYLGGPKDKLYSLFYVKELPQGLLQYKTEQLDELDYISNKNLQDIHSANFSATKHALISHNLPNRIIMLKDLSAKSVGALVAHSMLEIIVLSNLMQINPFNQPGVELIKTESKRIVKEGV